jgi:hypothetical protein
MVPTYSPGTPWSMEIFSSKDICSTRERARSDGVVLARPTETSRTRKNILSWKVFELFLKRVTHAPPIEQTVRNRQRKRKRKKKKRKKKNRTK